MKKSILFILAAACAVLLGACTNAKSADNAAANVSDAPKAIVVYFSVTGNTKTAAQQLAEAIGTKALPIEPEQPYTPADIDYNNKNSRSSAEMNDENARPKVKNLPEDISQYNIVFLGYPIWWDLAPRTVNSFIEANDLKGKTVIPFATSGGSTIDNSEQNLKKQYPDLDWKPGKRLSGLSQSEIKTWATSNLK